MQEKTVSFLKRGLHDLCNLNFIKINANKFILIQSKSLKMTKPSINGLEIITVNNYDEDNEIESILQRLVTRYKIVAICSTSETDVLRTASWRDKFNIFGQSFLCAKIYRDKVEMKRYLQKSKIAIPCYSRAYNTDEIEQFSDNTVIY